MRLTYWCGVSSDAISVCCVEVQAELESKAADLPVDLRSYSDLWP